MSSYDTDTEDTWPSLCIFYVMGGLLMLVSIIAGIAWAVAS